MRKQRYHTLGPQRHDQRSRRHFGFESAREALSLRQVHAAILPLPAEQRQTGELIYFAAERRAELVEKIRNMQDGARPIPGAAARRAGFGMP